MESSSCPPDSVPMATGMAAALQRLAGQPDDHATWSLLIEGLGQGIARVCRRLAPSAEGDDAVQETLLVLRRDAARFRVPPGRDPDQAARSWVLTVAAHVALQMRRSHRRSTAMHRRTRFPEATSVDPGTQVDQHETCRLVRQALSTLPPAMATALLLRHGEGLGTKQVALALGCPEGTAKALIHRGLARLRSRLGTMAAWGTFLVLWPHPVPGANLLPPPPGRSPLTPPLVVSGKLRRLWPWLAAALVLVATAGHGLRTWHLASPLHPVSSTPIVVDMPVSNPALSPPDPILAQASISPPVCLGPTLPIPMISSTAQGVLAFGRSSGSNSSVGPPEFMMPPAAHARAGETVALDATFTPDRQQIVRVLADQWRRRIVVWQGGPLFRLLGHVPEPPLTILVDGPINDPTQRSALPAAVLQTLDQNSFTPLVPASPGCDHGTIAMPSESPTTSDDWTGSISQKDGSTTLEVTHGHQLVFRGPVDTAEQRRRIPPEVENHLGEMNLVLPPLQPGRSHIEVHAIDPPASPVD